MFTNDVFGFAKMNEKKPYMVVNKVFSSYFKEIHFPIVTYYELERIIRTDS